MLVADLLAQQKMSWHKFTEVFLDCFVPLSLRDQMRYEFDHLEQGFMTVAEHEACFYALFKYSYASIFIKFDKI